MWNLGWKYFARHVIKMFSFLEAFCEKWYKIICPASGLYRGKKKSFDDILSMKCTLYSIVKGNVRHNNSLCLWTFVFCYLKLDTLWLPFKKWHPVQFLMWHKNIQSKIDVEIIFQTEKKPEQCMNVNSLLSNVTLIEVSWTRSRFYWHHFKWPLCVYTFLA